MEELEDYYLHIEEEDVDWLYRFYHTPDHWSNDELVQVVSHRVLYLEQQSDEYFSSLGIRSKQEFIGNERSLIVSLLYPRVLLREPYSLTDAERGRVLSACEMAGGALEWYMRDMKELLQDVFFNQHPDKVYKLLGHIYKLIIELREKCRPLGFLFEEHLFYDVLRNWSNRLNIFYSEGRLATRLKIYKSNPENTPHKKAKTFASCFVSSDMYEQVQKHWLQKKLIDRSGKWIYKKKGRKGLLAALLKFLYEHPKGFDKGKVGKQELSLIAKYSFGISFSDSLIAHKSPVGALDEYLPIGLL